MQVDARTHAQTHSTCAQVSRDGFNTRAASAVSPDSWAVSHTDRPSSSVGSHTACAKLTHTLLSTCTRGITGIAHREPGYNVNFYLQSVETRGVHECGNNIQILMLALSTRAATPTHMPPRAPPMDLQSVASSMATPAIVHFAGGCFVLSCIAKTKPEPGVAVPGVARSVCL